MFVFDGSSEWDFFIHSILRISNYLFVSMFESSIITRVRVKEVGLHTKLVSASEKRLSGTCVGPLRKPFSSSKDSWEIASWKEYRKSTSARSFSVTTKSCLCRNVALPLGAVRNNMRYIARFLESPIFVSVIICHPLFHRPCWFSVCTRLQKTVRKRLWSWCALFRDVKGALCVFFLIQRGRFGNRPQRCNTSNSRLNQTMMWMDIWIL